MCNLEEDFINTTDDEGHSVLRCYAVVKYSLETVLKLLKSGADVNLRSKKHKLTALHLAAKKKHNVTMVEKLIKAGASLESPDHEELSPLHMSILKSSSDVVQCLIDNGADVNIPDKNLQFTPLHLVVYQQRRDLFQLLMENGADVNHAADDGFTPLHLSAMLGCSHFTKALIHHGAKVDCLYRNEFTPLHLAATKSHLVDNEDVKEADAIRCGNENSLIVKLMKYPYDTTGQDYEAVVHLLIRNGADVNALTTSGWSSLHFATKLDRHSNDFAKILLQYGANVDCKETNFGFTPLHFALKNNKALVENLIDAGADVNSPTKDGKSPLHLALENNRKEVLKLLVRRGVKLNCTGKRCLYTFLYITARNDDEDLIDELEDFQETPLLVRAINSLNDSELKRAIMCLCAIVDASNEIGCMPVNVEIESDYAESAKSLRINRVNVHATEVYSKFACDRVLSGALLRDERKSQYVYDYLSMLNAVKLPLVKNYLTSRTQSIADFYTHRKLRTHFEICSDEVDKLKSYVIARGNDDDDDDVSLYNVLHMRPKRRRCFMKNLNFHEIESEFPIYCKLVLARYREDLIKRALMDTVQLALCKFVNIELPIICVEEIFADLGVMNMIATIEAAEMDI